MLDTKRQAISNALQQCRDKVKHATVWKLRYEAHYYTELARILANELQDENSQAVLQEIETDYYNARGYLLQWDRLDENNLHLPTVNEWQEDKTKYEIRRHEPKDKT